MAGIKIVDLPALGRDLISTDLLEVSLNGSGSRKITGQEIMNASKLAVGSTPIVSGTVGRLLFQGTGNVLGQNSFLFWDNSNTRLGVGTNTPLYTLDVAGNIHGNGIFAEYNIVTTAGNVWLSDGYAIGDYGTGNNRIEFYNNRISLFGNGNEAMRIVGSTQNVLIGTTTDAGFKLNVNGTARVQGNTTIGGTTLTLNNTAAHYVTFTSSATALDVQTFNNTPLRLNNGGGGQIVLGGSAVFCNPPIYFGGGTTNGMAITAGSGATQKTIQTYGGHPLILQSGGNNVLINTTTDAGFRLDVNGTARVSGALTLGTGTAVASSISYGATYGLTMYGNTGSNSDLLLTDRNGNLRFRIVNGGNILQTATTINDVIIGGTSFASKSVYTSPVYGLTLGGSAGSIFNFSLLESTGNNGLFIDSSGNTKIGVFNSTYNSSAILEAVSTTRGFLPPRMTNAQRAAIASPAVGLIVYCTDSTEGLYVYKSTGWTFMV